MVTLNPAPVRDRSRAVMTAWRELVIPRLQLGDAGYLGLTMSKKAFWLRVRDAASNDLLTFRWPSDGSCWREPDSFVDLGTKIQKCRFFVCFLYFVIAPLAFSMSGSGTH